MSGISIPRQDGFIPESEQHRCPPSVEPQSQPQLPSRPLDHFTNTDCATEGSAATVKPLHPGQTEIHNAVIDIPTQCTAPHPSPLLALPFELRRKIIHLVLPYSRSDDRYHYLWHLGNTSVLRTCHQLHEEGTAVLYTCNTFQVLVRPAWQHSNKMWLYHDSWNGAPAYRDFLEPFPMRPEDVRLVRRWNITLSSMYLYIPRGDCNDPSKRTLVVHDRVQNLLDGVLRGRHSEKTVRVRWEGAECEAHSSQHRETILKPLRDKGIAVEEAFNLW